MMESCITWIGGFLILLFLSGVFIDVATRILGFTIAWMQEITTFIFVWAVFLGAAVVYRQGILYTITILPKAFPAGILRFIRVIVIGINFFALYILLVYGFELSIMGIGRTSQPSGVRIVYAFASIPLSAAFMALFSIEITLNLFSSQGELSCS